MSKTFTKSLIAGAVLVAGLILASSAQAGWPRCNNYYYYQPAPAPVPAKPVITGYETVIHSTYKPQSTTRRTEVASGSQITLFASFLGNQPGHALLNLGGTSTECNITEWTNNSVSLELPRLGLSSSKEAEVELLLPDGRIIKTFRLSLVSPPDVVTNGMTTQFQTPPAPVSRPTTYVTSVQGGLVLQASFE
jgi:hypothetical protein